MHLDHKLPWSTLASHFKLVRHNKSVTPRCTNIFSAKKENESKEIGHFERKFCATLKEFSLTEQQKCNPDTDFKEDGDELFSDDVLTFLERHYNLETYDTNSLRSNPLSSQHQSLQYWVDRAKYPGSDSSGYTTSEGDLADALKGLIIISAASPDPTISNEAMRAVLRLARHPDVPLQDLDSLSWGHSFGLDHVGAAALRAYLLLNVVDRLRDQGSKISICELQNFLSFALDSLCDVDYPSQKIPHNAFCRALGGEETWAQWRTYTETDAEYAEVPSTKPLDPLVDYRNECQQYLRVCFGILYKYDVLRRIWYGDANADAHWKYDLNCVLRGWGASAHVVDGWAA
jgi:hypothetical protein